MSYRRPPAGVPYCRGSALPPTFVRRSLLLWVCFRWSGRWSGPDLTRRAGRRRRRRLFRGPLRRRRRRRRRVAAQEDARGAFRRILGYGPRVDLRLEALFDPRGDGDRHAALSLLGVWRPGRRVGGAETDGDVAGYGGVAARDGDELSARPCRDQKSQRGEKSTAGHVTATCTRARSPRGSGGAPRRPPARLPSATSLPGASAACRTRSAIVQSLDRIWDKPACPAPRVCSNTGTRTSARKHHTEARSR